MRGLCRTKKHHEPHDNALPPRIPFGATRALDPHLGLMLVIMNFYLDFGDERGTRLYRCFPLSVNISNADPNCSVL